MMVFNKDEERDRTGRPTKRVILIKPYEVIIGDY